MNNRYTMNFFLQKLTKSSGDLIDWTRSANLIRTGDYRYNKKEILVRAGILFSTVMSGCLGAYFNDEEKTKCASSTMAIITGFMGLIISHAYVAYPLLKKRYDMSKACQQLIKNIELKMNELEVDERLRDSIYSVMEQILKSSSSDHKQTGSSQTWGWRKRLLSRIDDLLSDNLDKNNFDVDFWNRDVDSIILSFSDNKRKNTYQIR